MIKIEIDPVDMAAVQETVGGMMETLDHLKRTDLGNELAAWQREDLHRKYPFVMRSRARGRATTYIRPHSLYEVQRSARYQERQGRRLARLLKAKRSRKLRPVFRAFEPKTSMRPILRAGLVERLAERMIEMVSEK